MNISKFTKNKMEFLPKPREGPPRMCVRYEDEWMDLGKAKSVFTRTRVGSLV